MPICAFQVVSPAPRERWQALLQLDPEAIPYQTPAWLDCICALGGYEDASRLYEAPDGRQFVLPLVRRRGLPVALTTAASLPNSWGMGGVVASGPVCAQDIAAIFADLASLPYSRISVRPNPRTGELWAAARPANALAVPRRAHVLDLEGGFGTVWAKRFHKKTRSRIRKAERSGVVVECDTSGRLVPIFYDLLRQSLDRWARQQHEPFWLARWRGQRRDSLRKFQVIAQRLGEACRIWVAWVNGQPAAASLVLQYGNVNDSRSAMNKDLAAPSCANDLLQKLTIEDACRAGCRYYHMGETGFSASLEHFKGRYGAVPYSYAEYHLERLPLTWLDTGLRRIIKRLIGFRDV